MKLPQLPQAEKNTLKLGYMRLSDSAPLILAKEAGLFAELDLDVELVREVSWANLRDRLVMGDLDAAQMLSPLPMMTTYGAGGMRANLMTGLVLSLNGNAITLSSQLWHTLVGARTERPVPPVDSSVRLKQLINDSKRSPAFTFATVNLYSMHTILLRMWLKAGGIDPEADIRIIVLPPEQMCDSLARGIIDGYCVGEPWNSLAVAQGVGGVICTGHQIWQNAPEKVLAVTEQWHQKYGCTHLRLRVALMKACQLLADREQRLNITNLLSSPEYLDLPKSVVHPSLSGEFVFAKNEAPVDRPHFHVFSIYQAGFPWRSAAESMLTMTNFALAKPVSVEQSKSLSQQCYRPDLYREAARYLGLNYPSKDSRPEGQHTIEWEFEPGIILGPDKAIVPLE